MVKDIDVQVESFDFKDKTYYTECTFVKNNDGSSVYLCFLTDFSNFILGVTTSSDKDFAVNSLKVQLKQKLAKTL